MHINPYGDAEACPASPHSDTNLKEKTLLQAIASPLFFRIRESELIALPHEGGCALAEHEPDLIKVMGTQYEGWKENRKIVTRMIFKGD